MNSQKLMIDQINRQISEWQFVHEKYGHPRIGWVKTLRKALGMTAQQLAECLGVGRARIVQIEDAEKRDAITRACCINSSLWQEIPIFNEIP